MIYVYVVIVGTAETEHGTREDAVRDAENRVLIDGAGAAAVYARGWLTDSTFVDRWIITMSGPPRERDI